MIQKMAGRINMIEFIRLYKAGNRERFPMIQSIRRSSQTDYRQSGYNMDEEIHHIIEELQNYPNITDVDLTRSEIHSLPESIGTLTSLQDLQIENCFLTTIPSSIGNLTSLTALSFYGNQITSVPESIGNLHTLQHLVLSYNLITQIPESIGGLTSLRSLYLNNNVLVSLPESIGNLNSLTHLFISTNSLRSLPESIGNLRSLYELHMSNNRFTSLPENIVNLNLRTMLADGNTIQGVSQPIRDWVVRIPDRRMWNDQPPPVRPRVNAVQVHREANKVNLTTLTTTLQSLVGPAEPRSEENFRNYLKTTLQELIATTPAEEKSQIEEDYNGIATRLSGINFTAEEIGLFTLILEYVKRQSPTFQSNYIKSYTMDCAHAYEGTEGMSCGQGIKERLYLTLLPACMSYEPGTAQFKSQKCGTIINALENKELYSNTNGNTNSGNKNIDMIINKLKYQILHAVKEEVCTETNSSSTAGARKTTKTAKEIEDLYRMRLTTGIKEKQPNLEDALITEKITEVMTSLGAGTAYSVFDPDEICEFTIPQGGGKKSKKPKKNRLTQRKRKNATRRRVHTKQQRGTQKILTKRKSQRRNRKQIRPLIE